MNIYDTLKTSIASKKPCAIAKPNEPERKVCPYVIGKSSKGEVNVLYYQFGGYSLRGLKGRRIQCELALQPRRRDRQCRNLRRTVASANPEAENARELCCVG